MNTEPTVQFTVTEVNNILGALGKIPAEYSMNLILFIKQTADKQLGPVAEEVQPDEFFPQDGPPVE